MPAKLKELGYMPIIFRLFWMIIILLIKPVYPYNLKVVKVLQGGDFYAI